MTNPSGPGTTTSPLKRYGPIAAIVVVLLVIGVVVVVAGGKGESGDAAPTSTGTSAPAAAAATPITYEQAKAEGTEGSTTWVDNCDPATGRIEIPSVYAPACVPAFEGDNGGATSKGVTADSIKVVFYQMQQNADALAALAGATDTPEVAAVTRADYVTMLNDVSETYGRTVEVITYQATGSTSDATAALADATSIIDMEPFAVIAGPTVPSYVEEITRAGIICIACGTSVPDQFYQDHAPYMWGAGPSTEQYLGNFADFIQNRVLGRKAEFAGDALKDKDRVIGSVNYDLDPPVFNVIRQRILDCGGTLGYEPKISETYLFDMGKLPDRAATIIAKMKAEGVTTIIFLGDPIMPIYLTQQATAQDYYPEWIIAGTALTDTTALARRYDQAQWTHAFGLSNLAARTPRELAGSYQLHEWYFGKPPVASNTNGIILPPLSQLFLGIHLAGANLTFETFRDGMFNSGTAGGGPTNPEVGYGPDTGFKMFGPNCEPDIPRPDYLSINDTTEIWWDAQATGVDEQGKDGLGMWTYANNGKRYGPGEMPNTPTDAFKRENTVTLFSEVPPEDRTPDYPSPAPAAP